jgi:hypothetical protein
VVTASARPDVLEREGNRTEGRLHLPAEQVGQVVAAIGNVHHVDAGHHLEQLESDMGRRSDTVRCHVDLAWTGLGVGDQFRNGLGRE